MNHSLSNLRGGQKGRMYTAIELFTLNCLVGLQECEKSELECENSELSLVT